MKHYQVTSNLAVSAKHKTVTLIKVPLQFFKRHMMS